MLAASSLPLFGIMAAFGIAPETVVEPPPLQTLLTVTLPAPELATLDTQVLDYWREERVQKGDTVGQLLTRVGVSSTEVAAFLRDAQGAKTLRQLVPGRAVRVHVDEGGGLLEVHYLTGDGVELAVVRDGDGYSTVEQDASLERRVLVKSGVIQSSLFGATDAAHIPDAVAVQMAEIFGGDLDFHRDIRKGDTFQVVYEGFYGAGGELVRSGRVLAAEYVNDGQRYQALWFEQGDGRGSYYTPEGRSVRKAFLRSPIEFSRVSSGFTNARFHPVLKEWRAHRGVDYAAPTGTRIRATADGRVSFAGRKGGYGNLVVVEHANGYSTAYGHLSGFARGLRNGARVSQGDVIGYVGMTGLATGPHLHYEFRVNGVQRDPLKVATPVAFPIPAGRQAEFRRETAPLSAQLALLRGTNLARLPE